MDVDMEDGTVGSGLTGASSTAGPGMTEASSAPQRVEGEGFVSTPRTPKGVFQGPPQTLRDEKPRPHEDEVVGEEAYDIILYNSKEEEVRSDELAALEQNKEHARLEAETEKREEFLAMADHVAGLHEEMVQLRALWGESSAEAKDAVDRAIRSETTLGDYVETARLQGVQQEENENRAADDDLRPRPDGMTNGEHRALEDLRALRRRRGIQKSAPLASCSPRTSRW